MKTKQLTVKQAVASLGRIVRTAIALGTVSEGPRRRVLEDSLRKNVERVLRGSDGNAPTKVEVERACGF